MKNLGVAWEFRTNTVRGLEATPIVSNGIMFVTGSWSKVWALDAKTGRQLWFYDPEVPGQWGRYACCDVVNRGVAVWKGAVYLGTLDGRLIKLDAKTGKPVWDINTIDRNRPYTITGAPRVVKGMVLIGNGGAEYGVRGYLTAYDADIGRQMWRFYVVPGNPAQPPENKAMADALKTWSTRRHEQQMVGAGRRRHAVGFDGLRSRPRPALCRHRQRRVVEPQSPFARRRRQSLSLLHRRLEAGDGRDGLVLSDDARRRLGLHRDPAHHPGRHRDRRRLAPCAAAGAEDGFFYVIDRATGKLISATPYTTITWAKGVDMKTGRPIENPGVRYARNPSVQVPGPVGAHNWQPMAFNPETGLVYIPVIDGGFIYASSTRSATSPARGTSATSPSSAS